MPRGGHYNPGRPAIYDRAPSGQALGSDVTGVGPHGVTQRFTRTIPAGQRAVLQAAFLNIIRLTAAAPVGLVQAYVIATIQSVTTKPLNLWMLTNGVGDTQHESWSGELYLNAGDQIAGFTTDAGTGGTLNYSVFATSTEFAQ